MSAGGTRMVLQELAVSAKSVCVGGILPDEGFLGNDLIL